jgi:hypothetical protein
MSEWTTTPDKTGAYWCQVEGADPDIVWIHRGLVWSPLGESTVADDVKFGVLFYGPLDKPPPMPTKDAQ